MAEVNKRERALLIVANLSSGGDEKLQKLYEWLDANAVKVTTFLLKNHYHQIDALTNEAATFTNFISRVTDIARNPQVRVLDVILVLHGQRGKLHFDDGDVSSGKIKEQLKEAKIKHRLRLLYSTACYGATHAQDFVDAGFRTASGAEGICANGPYDLPVQLFYWKENQTYKSAVNAGNEDIGVLPYDLIAKGLGFRNVNSHKIIIGKKYTRITSPAQ
jgi:hypothetical protein